MHLMFLPCYFITEGDERGKQRKRNNARNSNLLLQLPLIGFIDVRKFRTIQEKWKKGNSVNRGENKGTKKFSVVVNTWNGEVEIDERRN